MKVFLLAWSMCAILAGCTLIRRPADPGVGPAHLTPIEGSEAVVERSEFQMPAWARQPTYAEDGTALYFVGLCSGAASLRSGRDCAYKDAVVGLARSLGTVFRVDDRTDLGSSEDTDDTSVAGLPMILLSRGAQPVRIYWEEKAVVTDVLFEEPRRIGILYDVWVRVRYPKSEWLRYRRTTSEDFDASVIR
jgi:hypothetical protein